MTTEEFVDKAKSRHGDRYDYSKVCNPLAKEKVVITCSIHGEFTQEANTHINKGQGCPDCGRLRRANSIKSHYSNDLFIEKASAIHQNKYSYVKTTYIKNTVPVTITCPTHGDFEQEPRSHLVGNGCMKCARDNNNYWSYSGWTKAGEESSYFDGYKVYVVRCYNANEEFYKIGKTYNPVWLRFSRGQIPYEYEVLKTFEGSGLFICELEEELLKMNFKYKYTPMLDFAGSQECFSSLDGIKEKINGN